MSSTHHPRSLSDDERAALERAVALTSREKIAALASTSEPSVRRALAGKALMQPARAAIVRAGYAVLAESGDDVAARALTELSQRDLAEARRLLVRQSPSIVCVNR